MKRRDALKNLGFAAGFAIVTPTIFSFLQSCTTTETETWAPKFLSLDEKTVLTNLVDIILPKTPSTPSATEVKVPQFIDQYILKVLEDKDQKLIRNGFDKILAILKSENSTEIKDLTTEQYTNLLDKYMLVKDDVDQERDANPEALIITNSEFLNQLKWMTINAYRNSEEVGENILVYDPIPSEQYCGDLQELTKGKLYSL